MSKYYIWSKKHTHGERRVFWGPKFGGYTCNLQEAGVYTDEELRKSGYSFKELTEENAIELQKFEGRCEESYIVKCENVCLLGGVQTVIVR